MSIDEHQIRSFLWISIAKAHQENIATQQDTGEWGRNGPLNHSTNMGAIDATASLADADLIGYGRNWGHVVK